MASAAVATCQEFLISSSSWDGGSNDCDQRLATIDELYRRILSRVRCIAWMLIMASCVEATESYKPVTSSRLGVICAEA